MSTEDKVDTLPKYEVQVLTSMKKEASLVSAVNTDQAWVADNGDNILHLVSPTGQVFKMQKN